MQLLQRLYELDLLRDIDLQFARWLGQRFEASNTLLTLAAVVSQQSGEGHACLHLQQLPNLIASWPDELHSEAKQWYAQLDAALDTHQLLLGCGTEPTPLVLERNRVYLYRLWYAEKQVAEALLARAQACGAARDLPSFGAVLDQLFIGVTEQPDWQRVAVVTAVARRLAVISGGPGTGKTTTVTRMLAMYLQQTLSADQQARPHILLAAPTGKAAARLSESIAGAKAQLTVTEHIKQLIPEQGVTLHRLLGARPRSVRYRYNRDNPLQVDLLVVDEASMIDLPLMAALLEALPEHARLVLIGDKQQLASVEAGSVLGDLCAMPSAAVPTEAMQELFSVTCGLPVTEGDTRVLADSVAFLRKSYRFAGDSGIGELASAVNRGSVKQTQAVFRRGFDDLNWIEALTADNQHLVQHMAQKYSHYLSCFKQAISPDEAHAAFAKFQLLCGLRKGVFGVDALNEAFESYLERRGLKAADNRWYEGRPVIITRNDAALQLYNGDVGITLFNTEQQQLRVYFEQGGEMRSYSTSRVPQHETVFAMTVHKSQGSEFKEITLVLTDSARVMSRELVYTGITRAKQHCNLYGKRAVMLAAVDQPTVRMSGLAERLWG